MKYASLLIFAAALIWTWALVHNNPPVSDETHMDIQWKLRPVIAAKLKEAHPTATNIKILKVTTEVDKEDKLNAYFSVSFSEQSADSGLVNSQVEGQVKLERLPPDESGNDRWKPTEFQTTGNRIQFDEATVITGSADGSATEANNESAPAEAGADTGTETSAPGTPNSPAPEASQNPSAVGTGPAQEPSVPSTPAVVKPGTTPNAVPTTPANTEERR